MASIERIILEPLSESDTNIAATSDLPVESSPQGLLNLNFIFERPPTRQGIERFGEALKLVWYKERMPIKRIVWGGLSSWEANLSSTSTSAIVIKAADKFKAGLYKKSQRPVSEKRIWPNSSQTLSKFDESRFQARIPHLNLSHRDEKRIKPRPAITIVGIE